MSTIDSIKSALQSRKAYFFDKYGIASLAIFGSYARSEQDSNSDLDLLVDFDRDIGLEFISLANELEKYIGLKIDLVSKKGVKKSYLDLIIQDCVYV